MTNNDYAIFEIVKASLWPEKGIIIDTTADISDEIRTELRVQTIEGLATAVFPELNMLRYAYITRFFSMLRLQSEIINVLENEGISVAVLKGTVAGLNYPQPYLRDYGDIDILVCPSRYQQAIRLLKENKFNQQGEIGKKVTSFSKSSFIIELHQNIPGVERVKEGEYIYQYVLSGLEAIQYKSINGDKYTFPVLPWKQNGLEFIWHIRVHLYNGLGLRHIIDWMMFVNSYLKEDHKYEEFQEILVQSGLLTLAKTVTRMCQIYLGLDESITWCKDVDEELCEELMDFILEQGNFGYKKQNDKVTKVLTKYRNPLLLLKKTQQEGVSHWSVAKKHIVFRPFAWGYVIAKEIAMYKRKGGIKQLLSDWNENKRRRKLFDRLYGGETGKGIE